MSRPEVGILPGLCSYCQPFSSLIFTSDQKLAGEAVTKLPLPEARAHSPPRRDNMLSENPVATCGTERLLSNKLDT